MANWYVSKNGYNAVATWVDLQAGLTVSPLTFRRPTAPTAGNERVYRVSAITTGTTGAAEPTWPLTANGTVVDGGVTWTECTAQEAYQIAGNWTAPAANMEVIGANSGGRASTSQTDTIYIASDHAETWTSARSWTRLGNLISVQVAGSTLPPGAAAVLAGASIATTGASNIALSSGSYFSGLTISAGDASNAASIIFGIVGGGTSSFVLETCSLKLTNTNTASRIQLGATAVIASLALKNTTLQFGNASQGVAFATAPSFFSWANTAGAILGTNPTTLFVSGSVFAQLAGIDLSGFTGQLVNPGAGASFFWGILDVVQCRLNSATVISANYRTIDPFSRIQGISSDDATANLLSHQVYGAILGGVQSSSVVYRDGGSSVAGQPYSFAILPSNTTNGSPTYGKHPITPPIRKPNASIGSPITITVHGIADKAAMPTNDWMWIEAEYLPDPAVTLWSGVSAGPTPLGNTSPSNWTATTEDWGAGLPARQNTTAYGLGDVIGVASNSLRAFFCIAAGTTAGSEPGGYATAVDGDSIVDNAATFRAGWRFKMQLSITPQRIGYISVTAHDIDVQAASTRVYVDAKLEIS